MKKITFGLTGGIACGKSTVTKTFIRHDLPMVDADIVARQVVSPNTIGLSKLIECFGIEYLNTDGSLKREELGNLVFLHPELLNKINAIVMPLLQEEAEQQLNTLHAAGYPLVGYDAALICETGSASRYRPLIVVRCPQVTQLERLMRRNGLTEAEAMARINSQMPTEKKVAMADYVIDTSGTIEESISQTEKIIERLRDFL